MTAAADSPAPEIAPAEPLARNRDFLVVLVGQGISSLGDAVTNTALPILVLLLSGSGFAMGIVGVLSTLPDLLIGLPAGAFADRWDRRRMMFLGDVGRAVLTALVPISVWLGGPTLAIIIGVAFPLNALRVLWLAAWTAAVPSLVGRAQVPRGNAIFEAVFTLGWIIGPAVAGVLSGTIGPGPTIAIDGLSFAVSAGSVLFIHRSLRPPERPEPTHIVADIREGIRFLAGHRTLRIVVGLWTTSSVISAGLTASLIFYLSKDRGQDTAVVGIVLSAFAVGSFAGSAVAARWSPRAVGHVMIAGVAGTGAALVASVGTPVAVIVGVSLLAGVLNALVAVAYLSLRTQLSPDALLGRVGATARTLSVGLMPVGSLVAGIALDAVGGGVTLLVMGVAMIVSALAFGLARELRRARILAVEPA